MKTILSSLILLFSLFFVNIPAFGQNMIGRTEGMEITLTQAPCRNKDVLALIKPEFHAKYKAGSVVLKEMPKPVGLCWSTVPEVPDVIFVVDELGAYGEISISIFKKK